MPVTISIAEANVKLPEKIRLKDKRETSQSDTNVVMILTMEKYVDLLEPLKNPKMKCMATKKPTIPH
jgi:hypothetical protein